MLNKRKATATIVSVLGASIALASIVYGQTKKEQFAQAQKER